MTDMTKWEEFAQDFPQAAEAIEERFAGGIPKQAELRDNFAAKALDGALREASLLTNTRESWARFAAVRAYEVADAMLLAREERAK